jgi:CDP-2,3-bis-(O-geranylgeranyl)-sn-glycerol synthase
MLYRLAQLVWFMAPAYVANMAAPFARFWPGWNRPIAARRLGTHKTMIGAALGIAAGVAAAFAQSKIPWRGSIVPGDGWGAVGLRLGAGAIAGDAIKSLFKRRRGVPPGGRWSPADQLDFVLGALLLGGSVAGLGWGDVAAILAFTFAADIAVNHIAFRLRIRDTAW